RTCFDACTTTSSRAPGSGPFVPGNPGTMASTLRRLMPPSPPRTANCAFGNASERGRLRYALYHDRGHALVERKESDSGERLTRIRFLPLLLPHLLQRLPQAVYPLEASAAGNRIRIADDLTVHGDLRTDHGDDWRGFIEQGLPVAGAGQVDARVNGRTR